MPIFEVLVPRRSADLMDIELVKDRFSWGAALLPPVWALAHRLWLEAFAFVVGLVLILVIGLFAGGEAAFWLYVLFAGWIGSSAGDLRIAALTRRGYDHAGTRVAGDALLAERDWLEEITAK